jgi:hypothetical protein
VLNNLLRPSHADIFRRWHASWPVPYSTDNGIKRLRYWQKRINSGKPAKAIERIIDLRRKAIAHVDLAPEFKEGRPQVWEIEYTLVAVASTVLTANLFATGRNIDAQQLRAHSRKRIEEFSHALLAGGGAREGTQFDVTYWKILQHRLDDFWFRIRDDSRSCGWDRERKKGYCKADLGCIADRCGYALGRTRERQLWRNAHLNRKNPTIGV